MNIETVQFFEYNIRSTVIDNVRMYLVADLLNQYNEKKDAHKKLKNYLRNEQTKRLLTKKNEILGSSDPSSLENTESKYTGEPNSVLVCQPCTNYCINLLWDLKP